MQATELLPLRVNDLKQFEYCPRIVFYNTVMPLDRKVTFKMQRGAEAEFRLDALEKRRSLRRYGLGNGERRFHVWLHSERLGLSGKMDLLIVSSHGYFPVDFKYTRAGLIGTISPNSLAILYWWKSNTKPWSKPLSFTLLRWVSLWLSR